MERVRRNSWLLLHSKWVLDWTSDLGDFCNNHPSNHYAYNIYLIMCKLIGWFYIDDLFPEEGGEE